MRLERYQFLPNAVADGNFGLYRQSLAPAASHFAFLPCNHCLSRRMFENSNENGSESLMSNFKTLLLPEFLSENLMPKICFVFNRGTVVFCSEHK